MVAMGSHGGESEGHRAACGEDKPPTVRKCLECDLLFESGIADSSAGRERCPQCGLQNSVEAGPAEEGAFVIRHSSPFR